MHEWNSDPRAIGKLAFAVGLALAAGGCSSGGGDGSTSAGVDRGGIDSPTIAVGRITGFGSVIVNGVRWNTDSAEVVVDDVAAAESALAIGQVVRIEGTRSGGESGNATRIETNDLLDGAIEAIDTAARELTVIGQTVTVTDRTAFDDDIVLRSLDGLAVGDRVEVNGFIGAGGGITATHIELDDDDDDDSEITGFVTNLDTGTLSFEINGVTIDYSAAGIIELPNGAPAEGQLIEVEGDYDPATRVLTARELDDDDFFDDRDDDFEAEIEGLVTRFASATDFDVSGVPVTTTAATEFDDGGASDLAEGIHVEVEGRFDGDGVLVAEELEFEDDDNGFDDDSGGAGDDLQCPQDNPVSGSTIESDVDVDGVCTLTNVTIAGDITVQPGSELTLSGSTVGKGLQSQSAVSIDISDTSFVEDLKITETSQRVELVAIAADDAIQLDKNQGQIHIEDFDAGQDLQLKESNADIFVSGAAGRNAQIEKSVGGTLTVDVTVGQDVQIKENDISGSTDVRLFGGDQAQCLDNSFDAFASGFNDVDGCIAQ